MKSVRLGIIGTNKISHTLANAMQEEKRIEITSVYSRKHETGASFAYTHNIAHVFTSLDDMLNSGKVDAVYIASPNSLHYSQTMACLSANKHVLVEKPFASNLNQAKAMVSLAKEKKLCLMEGLMPGARPIFKAIQNTLEGKHLRQYFSSYSRRSSRYEDYLAGKNPNTFLPEFSNGGLLDIGIYALYPIIRLYGCPQRIQAHANFLPTRVDASGAILLDYPNFTANIVYSKVTNAVLPTVFQCDEGSLYIDTCGHMNTAYFDHMNGTRENLTPTDPHNQYYYELKEWIDSILSGKTETPSNPHQLSLDLCSTMDSIRKIIGLTYPADQL